MYESLIWWVLILGSFPISYLTFSKGPLLRTRVMSRKVKFCAGYLLTTFTLYVVWLYTSPTGNTLTDFSPLGGYLAAMFFPWAVAIQGRR